MRIIKSSVTNDLTKDHIYSRNQPMSFVCPICHNKTVYDVEQDVYRPYEVGYDDLCVCEECGAEMHARPKYDGTINFELDVESVRQLRRSKRIDAANYGGAYDIDPDMFFTKDELVELGDTVADDFNTWVKSVTPDFYSPFELADVSMDEKSNLYVDISNDDYIISAVVRIDMRKIKKPSDINKYKDELIAKLRADYLEYTSTYSCDRSAITTSDNIDELSTLRSEIYTKASEVMKRPRFGFPEDEIKDYLFVDVSADNDMVKVEVRAELGFDSMLDLIEELNPIVSMYDSNAYFDMEEPGIASAYLSIDSINACKSTSPSQKITSGEDIGFNEWLLQNYGVTSDDMTDEDYDAAYDDYMNYVNSCNSVQSSDDVFYPNGSKVSDVDLDKYLDYNFGEDRDKDNSKYTKEEKQRSVNYWFKKNEPDPYDVYGAESTEDEEFDKYEDEIKEIGQEFTSENTSINSTKLPAVFKMVSFEPGTVNVDYGGGRFDNVADYLSQYDVINLVYDPYNRTNDHNKQVLKTIREHGGADTATCSNVLNVIKEPEVRLNVLSNIKKLVKPGGEVYITVYEGSGKGDEGPTKSGYQLNRKTADYMDEIQQVFPDAVRKGKLIIAHPSGGSVTSSSKVEADKTDDLIIDKKSEVMAGAWDVPDRDLEPPSDDTRYVDVDDQILYIELDADIVVDDEGGWEYDDDSYPWIQDDLTSEEYPNLELESDKRDVVEHVDDLLEEKLPMDPGHYHISGDVELHYDVDGAFMEGSRGWYSDEYGYDSDDELNLDNVTVKYDRNNSFIDNFKFTEI